MNKKNKALAVILITTVSISFAFTAIQKQEPEWKAPKEANKWVNPEKINTHVAADTKSVYLKMCRDCHGDLGNATVQKQKDGALYWKLTEGRGRMPSYKKMLTETQRWQLVNLIRTMGSSSVASF